MSTDTCRPHAEKMRAHGATELAIRCFCRNLSRLVSGGDAPLSEDRLRPVGPLPSLDELGPDEEAIGRKELGRLVHIVLNGGLATSMGGTGPKALLEARSGRSFLDIHLDRARRTKVRPLFMHSPATRASCLPRVRAALGESHSPWDFLQHMVPKLEVGSLLPVSWPQDPTKEWCPPGHGDVYPALWEGGLLRRLTSQGYRYALVSNVDNLAAWPDPRILGAVIRHQTPFLMEVCRRTEADRKGGHLARDVEGRFLLRERAQCPAEDLPGFEDTRRYPWFNTNNLWVDLAALQALLDRTNGVLDLPLIQNVKPVDPANPDSPRVIQLETAAGSAIQVFDRAQALQVNRGRFAPVKTLGDLLAIRSDAYEYLEDEGRIRLVGSTPPSVQLATSVFRTPEDLERAFPHGPPSLRACLLLDVRGPVRFGRGVTIRGRVRIGTPSRLVEIPDGAILEDTEVT